LELPLCDNYTGLVMPLGITPGLLPPLSLIIVILVVMARCLLVIMIPEMHDADGILCPNHDPKCRE